MLQGMQHRISVPVETLSNLLLRCAHASRLLGFVDHEIANLAVSTATEHVDHVGRALAELLGIGHGFGDAPCAVQRSLTPARGITRTPTDPGIPGESVPEPIAPRHTMR